MPTQYSYRTLNGKYLEEGDSNNVILNTHSGWDTEYLMASTKLLQKKLYEVLDKNITIDGKFGENETKKAVEALQKMLGLSEENINGVYDQRTMALLQMYLQDKAIEFSNPSYAPYKGYDQDETINPINPWPYGKDTSNKDIENTVIVEYHEDYNLDNTDFWIPAKPKITNQEGNRSAAAYNMVIDQFYVETNLRYDPRDGSTFCNVYALDVLDAMGVKIPRGRANQIALWLKKYGEENGWKEATAEEAQAAANRGEPAIVSWFNNSDEKYGDYDFENPWSHFEYPGHIAIIRPEDSEQNLQLQEYLKNKYPDNPNLFRNRIGVFISQAGSKNYKYTLVELGFSKSKRNQVKAPYDYFKYYIHK